MRKLIARIAAVEEWLRFRTTMSRILHESDLSVFAEAFSTNGITLMTFRFVSDREFSDTYGMTVEQRERLRRAVSGLSSRRQTSTNVGDVGDFLKSCDLSAYTRACREQSITTVQLLEFSDDELVQRLAMREEDRSRLRLHTRIHQQNSQTQKISDQLMFQVLRLALVAALAAPLKHCINDALNARLRSQLAPISGPASSGAPIQPRGAR